MVDSAGRSFVHGAGFAVPYGAWFGVCNSRTATAHEHCHLSFQCFGGSLQASSHLQSGSGVEGGRADNDGLYSLRDVVLVRSPSGFIGLHLHSYARFLQVCYANLLGFESVGKSLSQVVALYCDFDDCERDLDRLWVCPSNFSCMQNRECDTLVRCIAAPFQLFAAVEWQCNKITNVRIG